MHTKVHMALPQAPLPRLWHPGLWLLLHTTLANSAQGDAPAADTPANTPPHPKQQDRTYGHLRFTGTPESEPKTPEEPPETAGSEPPETESSSGSNPEDPPQRTLTEEERDRLHGRFDSDRSTPSQGEE